MLQNDGENHTATKTALQMHCRHISRRGRATMTMNVWRGWSAVYHNTTTTTTMTTTVIYSALAWTRLSASRWRIRLDKRWQPHHDITRIVLHMMRLKIEHVLPELLSQMHCQFFGSQCTCELQFFPANYGLKSACGCGLLLYLNLYCNSHPKIPINIVTLFEHVYIILQVKMTNIYSTCVNSWACNTFCNTYLHTMHPTNASLVAPSVSLSFMFVSSAILKWR